MVDVPKKPIPAEGNDGPTVAIDYIKGVHFKTITPSGLITSVTPQGMIMMVFFSERQAIPQRVVYKLNPDGSLGDAVETIGRDAIVREMEVAISVDQEMAIKLSQKLAELAKNTSE